MTRRRHPVEKAVSIFPAITNNKNSDETVSNESIKLCNRRPRYPSFGVIGRQSSISEKFHPPPIHINGVRFDERRDVKGNRRESLANIRSTTKRLNETAANFSSMLQVQSVSRNDENLVLPSIVQVSSQNLRKNSQNDGIPTRPFKAEGNFKLNNFYFLDWYENNYCNGSLRPDKVPIIESVGLSVNCF